MKNLFDYAPKELTQDGFLMWIFENYDDPELRDLSRDLILFLTEDENGKPSVDIFDPEFRRLKAWSQVNRMDVGCDFFFMESDSRSRRYLVIEDKTTSNEHNQLNRYNKTIAKWDSRPGCQGRAIKVYYKTNPIGKEEAERVISAGWRLIPLDRIVDFWQKYLSHPNLIVRFYAEHIIGIGDSSRAISKPEKNDVVAWLSYFEKVVVPAVKEACPAAIIQCNNTRYGYAYLNIYPQGQDRSKMPYLEIRSRDLLGDVFEARILKYGQDINMEGIRRLRECVSKRPTRLFKPNWGEKRIQQMAHTSKKDSRVSAESDESLIKSLILVANEFFEIIADWLKAS